MKKLTILVSLLCSIIFSSHLLIAQTDCATELSEADMNYIISLEKEQQAGNVDITETSIVNVLVTAHIIRNSHALGGLSQDSLFTSIEQLNQAFESTNFKFSLCSINYIDDNDFYNNLSKSNDASSTEFRMALPNLVEGCINIFYAPNITKSWASFPSYKFRFGKDWIVMNNAQAINGSTLAHEMGHYFNLYHTHEIAFGIELINGNNCEVAGDLICDTNAEPFVNSRGGDGLEYCVSQACTYSCTDSNSDNESYMPNVNNIMSYAPSKCRTSFSPKQINRMQRSYRNDRDYLVANCEQIAVKPCETSDKAALIALYNATDGPNWKNTWDLDTDHKTWYGVGMNGDGCVETLILESNNLSGFIPPEIGMLQNLALISFDSNNLSGFIPPEIGNLSQLRTLNLMNNQINGTFPKTLSSLTKLFALEVSNNNLSGCFEPELKNLCPRFWQPTNDKIGIGNNFDATWGDFCTYDAGICEPDNNNFIAGDYNKNGRVDHIDALLLGVSYGKTGTACEATNPNECPDWEDDINGINAKYLDGDQNGVINKNDGQVIQDNYGATADAIDI